MHASARCLRTPSAVYRGACYKLQSISFARVGWPALTTHSHWLSSIYKEVLGLMPSHLCAFMCQKDLVNYSLHSQELLLLSVSPARTELGKKAFQSTASNAWNKIREVFKLDKFIPLEYLNHC